MDYFQYDKNGFSCLIPIALKIRTDYPSLVAARFGKYFCSLNIVEIPPGIEMPKQAYTLYDLDNHPQLIFDVTYAGKTQTKWKGDEYRINSTVRLTGFKSFAWVFFLTISNKRIYIEVYSAGTIEDWNSSWLEVVNSINLHNPGTV